MNSAPDGKEVSLSLDEVVLGVPDVQAAHEFYTSGFSVQVFGNGQGVHMDIHGTGRISLREAEDLAADVEEKPISLGFRGYTMNVIVSQPSEVKALLDVAAQKGATVLKPARKALFGAFTAVYQAPDGAIWKLASASKKDIGPAEDPPVPTEPTVVLLGVAEPKASKSFYQALGMSPDRDYGSQYIDFHPASGTLRLGLMQRRTLAKDANVREDGSGFRSVVFKHGVVSRDEVEALLQAAVSAGGQVSVGARKSEGDVYSGYFTDPDGFLWKVTTGDQ